MLTYTSRKEISEKTEQLRGEGKSIGFVPTMGALHRGHLSLIERANNETDILVVSVFVNPLQFNNTGDLTSYPRDLQADKKILETVGCDIIFVPDEKEMYPKPTTEKYNFGTLETVMEGTFRPGHFNGVAIVVKRLFDIINPHRAYFGEKDYQQLTIIRKLVETEKIAVEIVSCPTLREDDGLALSSRNANLTTEQRKEASFIFQTLQLAKKRKNHICPAHLRQLIINIFDANKNFKLEYFEIVDDKTLQPIMAWESSKGMIAFVAVWLGKVRLIDNIRII